MATITNSDTYIKVTHNDGSILTFDKDGLVITKDSGGNISFKNATTETVINGNNVPTPANSGAENLLSILLDYVDQDNNFMKSSNTSMKQLTNSNIDTLITRINSALASSTKKILSVQIYFDAAVVPTHRAFIAESKIS